MPMLSLKEFARKGLNSDIAPATLDGNFLTYGNNFRVYDNAIHPFGGHTEFADLPASSNIGFISYVSSKSGTFIILLGTDKIYHYDGVFTEVQPDDFTPVSNSHEWSVAKLDAIPVINHPEIGPMFFNYSTAKYESLPWDKTQSWKDAKRTTDIIRSHKQFAFALGLTESGVAMPDAVRWSAPADIGSVPPTWDELDVTSTAGLTSLGGGGGSIIDGLSLRDSFVVYRERSISVFDYIGGRYVWRIRHLSESAGLLAPNCIAEAKGTHYFIGNGDIYRNDGTSIESIMHKRIKKNFGMQINPSSANTSFTIHNINKSEIWFCVPIGSSDRPNYAYIYNYNDNSWATRDLPNTLISIYGKSPKRSNVWDDISLTWDEFTQPWNEQEESAYEDTIITVIPGDVGGGKLIVLDTPISLTSVPFSTILERTEFALEGVGQVTTINKVFPYITGAGKVFIQFGSQQNAGGPTQWKTAVEFDPAADKKIDLRTTGELHCFRVYADDVSSDFAFIGMDIEYVMAGRR